MRIAALVVPSPMAFPQRALKSGRVSCNDGIVDDFQNVIPILKEKAKGMK
jgi:hypothetical protein